IVSGHLQLGSGGAPGASPTTQAASIVGGVLGSRFRSALGDRLPFDVLSIDVGGQGLGGTKLEAGRYLTDRLYVRYIGRIAADSARYQNPKGGTLALPEPQRGPSRVPAQRALGDRSRIRRSRYRHRRSGLEEELLGGRSG